MKKVFNLFICIGMVTVLSGCGLYTLAERGKPHSTRSDMTLVPQAKWNVHETPTEQVWTQYGLLLDRVGVHSGFKDGEPLAQVWGKDNPHVFKKGMTSLDVVTLYKDSLTFSGGINVEVGEIRPVKFAGHEGFEFEYTFRNVDGLKKKGLARGTISNDQLYLMAYSAPEIHYFNLVYPDAIKLMDSAYFPNSKEVANK